MENLRKNFLLGITENKIFMGEIEITTRNNYKEFTASFDVGEAFDIDDIDEEYKDEYKSNYWDCLNAETKINFLEDGNITRKEFFENWEIYGEDYREYKDCSCTDFEVEIENGQIINFETICCGQHDIREEKEEFKNIQFTNKKAVMLILELWDKYHLKNIENEQEEIESKIKYIIEKLDKYDKRQYKNTENIKNFIKENIKEI